MQTPPPPQEFWPRMQALYERLVWGREPLAPYSQREWPLVPLRVALLMARRFTGDKMGVHASGLAFFLLLSLVPLLAFLFLIIKTFKIPAMVKPYLLEFVAGGNTLLVEQISQFIETSRSGALGTVGIIALFLIGYQLLQKVKATLNLVWMVRRAAGVRSRLIEYLTVLAVTPLLLVISFSMSTFLAGQGFSDYLPGWEALSGAMAFLAGFSSFFALMLVVFYAYWGLPDVRVELWPALLGAAVTAATLRGAQNLYIAVMFRMSHYDLLYGALAFLPFLMLWFLLAWTVFLLGAQLTFVAQNYALLLEQRRQRASGALAPYPALLVLARLLRLWHAHGLPPTRRALVRETRLSRWQVRDALRDLAHARLIAQVEGMPPGFVPREAPEKWTVRDVLARLGAMPEFAELWPISGDPGGAALLAAFHRANQAAGEPLEQVSMMQLAGLTHEGEVLPQAAPERRTRPRRAAAEG